MPPYTSNTSLHMPPYAAGKVEQLPPIQHPKSRPETRKPLQRQSSYECNTASGTMQSEAGPRKLDPIQSDCRATASPTRMSPTSPSRKSIMKTNATLTCKVSSVGGWELVPVQFHIDGNGSKSDFVAIYHPSNDCLTDYEASLLTKGNSSGIINFVSPKEEGLYVLRLVRGDKEELASTAFRVVSENEKKTCPINQIESTPPLMTRSKSRDRLHTAL